MDEFLLETLYGGVSYILTTILSARSRQPFNYGHHPGGAKLPFKFNLRVVRIVPEVLVSRSIMLLGRQ